MNAIAFSHPGCFAPITKTRRRGFGLLEVILVFAVLIGVSATIFEVASSANDKAAVDHDRQIATTIAGNIMTLFPRGWDASNGPTVADTYYANPKIMGGPNCTAVDLAQSPGSGCYSDITGTVMGVGEQDQNNFGTAFSVGLTHVPDAATCAEYLAGGAQSMGGIGISSGDNQLLTSTSQGDIESWCQSHATGPGGSVPDVEVYFGRWQFLPPPPTPPSDPGLPPGWPPGLPPPGPGFTP